MSVPPSSASNTARWLLFAVFVALFAVNLWVPRDLWVQDEARYGEIVREMLEHGYWLVPHLNGHPYPDKPPLYFLLVAFLGIFVGQGEFAFRLLSVLATGVSVIGMHTLGRELIGRTVGFWAALLFMSALLTLIVGQIARMDMLLTAAAIYAWIYLARYQRDNRRRDLLGFWLTTALGIAIKGPIALLFTLLPGLIWQIWERDWRQACRVLHCLSGLLGLAALIGLWAFAVWQMGHGAYLENIWHKQLVGRAINSWSQQQPIYFYLLLLPLLVMPWTPLIIQGGWRLWRDKPPYWRAVASFTLVPFIGLSLVSGKLFIYLQPLLPGLCLAGALAATHLNRTSERPGFWISLPPVFYLLLLFVALGYGAGAYLHLDRLTLGFGAGAMLGLMAASTRAIWLKGSRWLWNWLGLSIALSWLVFGFLMLAVNPLFSARPLGETVADYAPPGTPAAITNTTRGILNYYAGRVLEELPLEQVPAWLREHPGGTLVIKTDDVPEVFGERSPRAACEQAAVFEVELKEYHVLADCRP